MKTPTNNMHVIVGAVFAALQIVNGAAGIGDMIGAKVAGLLAVILAACQAGWSYYQANSTTPNADVAAVKVGDTLVAGPAAAPNNGAEVQVITSVTGQDVSPA